MPVGLEEPEGLGVVADQQALGLRVVVEHHAVVLAPHAGRLVAAERGVGRVLVVAVGPHATGLDCAPHAEGAELLIGGERAHLGGELEGGFYFQPTVFKGTNDMRIFQEEIFVPVLAVTTFKGEEQALEIANDTLYGLGAGVWTRDTGRAFRMGRGIKAGRVWTNCYHLYPAHAAFGGYKVSGVGRENHKMMLDHYTQTKCMLVSYDPKPLGFF